ncbi:hypothetical protein ACYPKM_02215 [Pseudomonas aeruginosa]
MFLIAAQQLETLHNLIRQAAENPGDLVLVEKVKQESDRVQSLNQTLYVGTLNHKFGVNVYPALVPNGRSFTAADVEKLMDEPYDPEVEQLDVNWCSMPDEITIVEA